MGRRGWILVAALLAALPVADAILWRIAVDRLEAGFNAWVAHNRAAGWTVASGHAVSGGWPWAATLDIAGVSVSGGDPVPPGGFAWHAAGVTLRISLMQPRSMEIEARGEQRLRVGPRAEAILSGARLMVVASLSTVNEPRELEILADRPRLTDARGGDPTRVLSAEQVHGHVRLPPLVRTGDPETVFSFGGDRIALPTSVRWPLGATIASVAFEGSVEGPLPPAQPPVPWAIAWRDGGGALQLRNLVLAWGPLSMTASATLALDDQLQPMGAGTSRLTGYAATLDALAASGALSRSAAIAAKAVLSLLADNPADGDSADVEVPLTLQYRTLSMRQVPLVRLPELDWPGQ